MTTRGAKRLEGVLLADVIQRETRYETPKARKKELKVSIKTDKLNQGKLKYITQSVLGFGLVSIGSPFGQ